MYSTPEQIAKLADPDPEFAEVQYTSYHTNIYLHLNSLSRIEGGQHH